MQELISMESLVALAGLVGREFLGLSGPGLSDHKIAEIVYVMSEGVTLMVRANLLEYDIEQNQDDGCEITVDIVEHVIAEEYVAQGKFLDLNSRQLIKDVKIIRNFIKGSTASEVTLDFVTDVGIYFELDQGSFALIKTSYHDELMCVAYNTGIPDLPVTSSRFEDSMSEHFETRVQVLTIPQALGNA